MSNGPEAPWPAPAPARPARGPGTGWRILHSWWLLLPILGFGCLSGFGFLYVGLRARRPAWWIPGIVYALVGVTAFVFVGESDEASAVSDWAVGVVLAVWLGSVLHAALINPSWLRWRAGYVPWHAQPPSYPGPVHPYAPAAPTAEPSPVALSDVDVNAAGVDELAALPGFGVERARRVVEERDRRKGFASLAEFRAAADLAPHEYVRILGVLYCGPRSARPEPFPESPPPGRVLDV